MRGRLRGARSGARLPVRRAPGARGDTREAGSGDQKPAGSVPSLTRSLKSTQTKRTGSAGAERKQASSPAHEPAGRPRAPLASRLPGVAGAGLPRGLLALRAVSSWVPSEGDLALGPGSQRSCCGSRPAPSVGPAPGRGPSLAPAYSRKTLTFLPPPSPPPPPLTPFLLPAPVFLLENDCKWEDHSAHAVDGSVYGHWRASHGKHALCLNVCSEGLLQMTPSSLFRALMHSSILSSQ